MSQERAIRFTTDEDIINNQVPIVVKETLGNVFFLSERDVKRVRDGEGVLTDEIKALSIECASELQETTFNVDLPADFDLEALKLQPWDLIELEGVEYVEPWAILPSGTYNVNDAISGFSTKATGIKKMNESAGVKQATNEKTSPLPKMS